MSNPQLCLLCDESSPKSRQAGALVKALAAQIPATVYVRDISNRYDLLQLLGISGLPALVTVESHSGLQNILPSLQGLRDGLYLARREEVLALAAVAITTAAQKLDASRFAVARLASFAFEQGGDIAKGTLIRREGFGDMVFESLCAHTIDPTLPPEADDARHLYRPLPNHDAIPPFLSGMHLFAGQHVRYGGSTFIATQDLLPASTPPRSGANWQKDDQA